MSLRESYIRLHLAILLAGGTGLFGKFISLSEIPLVWYRVWFAAIILFFILFLGRRIHRIEWSSFIRILGCGMLLAIHWVFFYGSIKAANVSIGVVCFATVGFYTALFEPLINRHKPSWRDLAFSILTIMGILLIFQLDFRYRFGISLGMVSSIVYAFFSIFSKQVQESTGKSSSTMLLYELFGGGIILTIVLPIYMFFNTEMKVVPTTADFLLLLLFSSVFTIGPFLFQLQSLRRISAFTVNLSYNLEPVYSILFAMILLHEARDLNYSFWIGICLIILSVFLQTFSMLKKK